MGTQAWTPWALALVLALLLGGAILLADSRRSGSTDTSELVSASRSAIVPDPSIAALAAADETRADLAGDVARLRREIDGLHRRLDTELALLEADPDAIPLADDLDLDLPAPGDAAPVFQPGLLVALGLDPRDAERLHERYEQAELDRLFLRDQAVRGSWYGTPRFRTRRSSLEAELRGELGERDYDLLLFAAGRDNRVRVEHVLAGSPAALAGLEPGDVILRYAGERLYSTQELRERSHQGEAGVPVELEVRRGDREVYLRLPRGPLGVVPAGLRESPDLRR